MAETRLIRCVSRSTTLLVAQPEDFLIALAITVLLLLLVAVGLAVAVVVRVFRRHGKFIQWERTSRVRAP